MKSIANPVSCLPVSLYPEFSNGTITLKEWSEFARNAGADYIDMNVNFLPEMTEEEAGKIRESLAVPLLMLVTYSDFSNPDQEKRKLAVEKAEGNIRIAGALGADYLRLTAGQYYPGCDETETAKYIAECYEKCIPEAEKAGVCLLLENHSKPGAWEYPDFDYHYERMCLLWEEMKKLPIGVNYDTANAFALTHWRELWKAFEGRVRTLHFNDLVSIEPVQFSIVGEGIVPLEEILTEILKSGFTGSVCIEEAGMQGREGVARAFSNTFSLLRKLDESAL